MGQNGIFLSCLPAPLKDKAENERLLFKEQNHWPGKSYGASWVFQSHREANVADKHANIGNSSSGVRATSCSVVLDQERA